MDYDLKHKILKVSAIASIIITLACLVAFFIFISKRNRSNATDENKVVPAKEISAYSSEHARKDSEVALKDNLAGLTIVTGLNTEVSASGLNGTSNMENISTLLNDLKGAERIQSSQNGSRLALEMEKIKLNN